MLNVTSLFNVADNTGGLTAMCFRVLKKKKENATVGDLIICTIKTAKTNRKVKKSEIRNATIIRQCKILLRTDGTYISFRKNAIVLLNKQKNPIGTRIKGPVVQELRKNKLMKIISLASVVI